jgi:hypothetical protein
MKKTYINGIGSISAQPTYEADFLENAVINDTDNVLKAMQPSYKDVIPPAMIRRMATGVKMGIFSSNQALKEANIEVPDAIITGTGMGCVEDSDKFLKTILDNNEEFLTPTSFIQSTHNTVGAQIALGLQCKGYNFTYVNGAISFETALLDAKMQLENDEANSILVGGMDESSQHTIDLYKITNIIKSEDDKPYSLLNSSSNGIIFGEGSSFFVLESQAKSNSYATVEAISVFNEIETNEVDDFITQFLVAQAVKIEQIDALVLGINGDKQFDTYYQCKDSLFANTPQVYFKHLSGEYNTASAFGFWVASKIMQKQHIPEVVQINKLTKEYYNYVLLYNQYKGKDHSLILLKKC